MRRTNEDKRRAVLTLLNDPHWAAWDNSEIARKCGVVEGFVRKLRPAPPASSHSTKIAERRSVTRNGTTYPMNTADLGRRAKVGPRSAENARGSRFAPGRLQG